MDAASVLMLLSVVGQGDKLNGRRSASPKEASRRKEAIIVTSPSLSLTQIRTPTHLVCGRPRCAVIYVAHVLIINLAVKKLYKMILHKLEHCGSFPSSVRVNLVATVAAV